VRPSARACIVAFTVAVSTHGFSELALGQPPAEPSQSSGRQQLPSLSSKSGDSSSSDRLDRAPAKQRAPVRVPGRLLQERVPGYETREIDGFTMLLSTQAIAEAKKDDGKPFDALVSEFNGLVEVLPTKCLIALRRVLIWIEWDRIDEAHPRVLAKYYGFTMWRLDGSDHPLKSKAVEVLSLKRLTHEKSLFPERRIRLVLLHELAHVIHHQVLPGGFDNQDVIFAYNQAKDRRLYTNVKNARGDMGPAYASTNSGEYFAELTCAYLDRCYYFPFDREDLKKHDPTGYRVLDAIWKALGYRPKTVIAKSPIKSIPKKDQPDPGDDAASRAEQNEKTAASKLKQAKDFLEIPDKRDILIRRLDEITQKYPDTRAAKEAQAIKEHLHDK